MKRQFQLVLLLLGLIFAGCTSAPQNVPQNGSHLETKEMTIVELRWRCHVSIGPEEEAIPEKMEEINSSGSGTNVMCLSYVLEPGQKVWIDDQEFFVDLVDAEGKNWEFYLANYTHDNHREKWLTYASHIGEKVKVQVWTDLNEVEDVHLN